MSVIRLVLRARACVRGQCAHLYMSDYAEHYFSALALLFICV